MHKPFAEQNKAYLEMDERKRVMLKEAKAVQEKAAKLGFDWEKTEDVILKIEEELNELKDAFKKNDGEKFFEELGDLLFSIVNLSRFMGIEPEEALKRAIEKFNDRFTYIEEEVKSRGEPMTLAQMDKIWERVKSSQHKL